MKSQAVHFCSELLENIRDEMNDWDNCSTIYSPADGVVCFLSTRKKTRGVSIEAWAAKETERVWFHSKSRGVWTRCPRK